MADHNDFFTWQSLATFAGTTTATTAVTNGLCKVFPGIRQVAALGLALSIGFCIVAAVIDGSTGEVDFARPFATYFIAVINGFLVFASAAGLSAGGTSLAKGAGDRRATTRGGSVVARGAGGMPQVGNGHEGSFWRYWL